MIITNVQSLRDPFVLLENGTYYLYGTGVTGKDWLDTRWTCYRNDSGSLHGQWTKVETPLFQRPADAEKQLWAPEVHKYEGAYYMFCSYFSSVTQHRGSAVFRADNPTGPFVQISDGHITPKDWDAIDATLYVDTDGQPWVVFVHEWTCTEDKIGRMDAAMLSKDLTHMISQPVELFRADAPAWTSHKVTDGCFLHRMPDGKLIMLWSNTEADGYSVGIAHSTTGKVDGPWVQEDRPLFKRGTLDHHDGGHGMLFTDTDGQLYLCIHSPNRVCEQCSERTVLIPVKEEDGTIRIV